MSLRTTGAAYFHYLTGKQRHHWWDWPALLLLRGAAWIYRKAVVMKYRSFADHRERQERLPAVVISLGNITVGGTGKTPMACMLAKELAARGLRVALLNRGYRSDSEKGGASIMSDGRMVLLSAEEGGDEASLMARSLMGIPVLVGRNRAVSGRMAVEKFDSQVLILDDGFQHWQLYRDVDIVLVDGTNPFGNGHVLPRGILREPLEHLDRADLFVITKVDQISRDAIDAITADLRRYNRTAPVALSVHKPSAVVPFLNWNRGLHPEEAMPAVFSDHPVVAVSALGNPASFEETLRSAGFTVADVLRYEDHHHYGPSDIRRMAEIAAEKKCFLVTTEKDAVKLPADLVKEYDLPLYVLAITLDIVEGKEKIDAVLQSVLEDKL